MSEYTNVEPPFLEKLREIGWQVIDKDSGGGKGAGEIWEGEEGVDGEDVGGRSKLIDCVIISFNN